jgi:hypothetical protein
LSACGRPRDWFAWQPPAAARQITRITSPLSPRTPTSVRCPANRPRLARRIQPRWAWWCKWRIRRGRAHVERIVNVLVPAGCQCVKEAVRGGLAQNREALALPVTPRRGLINGSRHFREPMEHRPIADRASTLILCPTSASTLASAVIPTSDAQR